MNDIFLRHFYINLDVLPQLEEFTVYSDADSDEDEVLNNQAIAHAKVDAAGAPNSHTYPNFGKSSKKVSV